MGFSEDTEEEAVALEMPTYHFDPSQVSKFLRSAEIDIEEAKELFKRSDFDIDAANEFLKRSIEEVAEVGAVDIALGIVKQVLTVGLVILAGAVAVYATWQQTQQEQPVTGTATVSPVARSASLAKGVYEAIENFSP